MDRNYKERPGQKARPVALRKESVDRNEWIKAKYPGCRFVALRKESVDRNTSITITCIVLRKSLSARRAWIEIALLNTQQRDFTVALRKESVDRNLGTVQIIIIVVESLSARRAWIEIALLNTQQRDFTRRSPQGERG